MNICVYIYKHIYKHISFSSKLPLPPLFFTLLGYYNHDVIILRTSPPLYTGASLAAACDLGYTPIHRAAQKCSEAFFEALIPLDAAGAAAGAAAAAAGGVKKEEDGSGDPGANSSAIDARLPTGETALHLACQGCSVEAVRALLVYVHALSIPRIRVVTVTVTVTVISVLSPIACRGLLKLRGA